MGEPSYGIIHPSSRSYTIHLFGKEWGLSAFLSLGERLVLKLYLLLPDQVKASQSFLG